MPSGFNDVLQEFKKNEKSEDIIPILEDADIQKLIIAWTKIVIRRIHHKDTLPDTFNEKWLWLWKQISWSERELLNISGIPETKFCRIVNQSCGNRLIYPDGTVNTHASKYLEHLSLAATARVKAGLFSSLDAMQQRGKK